MYEQIISEGYEILKGRNYKPCQFEVEIKVPTGEIKRVTGHLDQPIYIGKDKFQTSRREMIKYLYSPSEEEWCMHENRYGLRTKKYLDTTAQRIGLESVEYTEDKGDVTNSTSKKIGLYANAEDYLTKVDEKYIYQMFIWHGDCTEIRTFTFKDYPSENNLRTANDLEEVKMGFLTGRFEEEFTCWECGRKVHWLDTTAEGLKEKMSYLEDKYCGC